MINIIGQILGTSGYDVHTRNLARAIGKLTDARLTIHAGPGWERFVDDKELDMIKKQSVDNEINLIITNPMIWRMNTNAKRNWVFLIFEGDKIPKCYLEECLNEEIEFIFVASSHTLKAVLNTMGDLSEEEATKLSEKLKQMPHGVDTSLFYPKDKPNKCVFMANKGFRNLEDRGGIQYLIRAYLEEFTDKDQVELLIKINPAYGIPNLQEMISKLSPRKEGLPLVNIDVQNYPYNKLVDLYNKGTIFVSPARAEAYNLPCIEAMACGLPVITTNFGGQIDYVNEKNGWLIGGKLEEVKHEVMYEGIKWLTPDLMELRKVMRKSYESYIKSEKELLWSQMILKSKEALKTARENSWDSTAKKICSLI